MPNAFRSLSVAMAAIGLLSCSDATTGTRSGFTSLAIAPRFSENAGRAAASLSTIGIEYDRVRIVIVRPQTDTLKDTTITIGPGDPPRTLELAVLAVPNETLVAAVRFAQGSTVLFEGSANVVAIAANAQPTSSNTTDVVVSYTGPGATAAKAVVTPGSGVYTSGSPTQFTAKAYDANDVELANTPFAWSTSDEEIATVSTTGLVTPKKSRGTVRVRAISANGKGDSVTVNFAPVATRLRVVQGAAQSGEAGTTLPHPVIVEAVADDGLPAPGAGLIATFTADNGGSITPSSVAFDADGRASATVKLGPVTGTAYLYTVTAGTFSLTFVEIAVPGRPTQLIASGSTTLTMTAGVPPDPLPTVRVADAQGNSVMGVALKISVQKLDGTPVVDPIIIPSDTVGRFEVIRAAPTLAGTYKVKIESGNPDITLTPLIYTITIEPAAPAKLGFKQQPTEVRVGQPVSPPVAVAILDQYNNIVTSATNTISLSVDPATGSGVSITGQGSISAVGGIATFANLTFGQAKTGVKIVAAGASLPQVLSSAFTIAPPPAWESAASMPTPRVGLGMAALGGRIFAVGGEDQSNVPVRTVESYDPATNTWTARAPMLFPRATPTVVAIGGYLFAYGGDTSGTGALTSTLEMYDPTTNTWTQKASAPAAVRAAAGATINGKLYIIGGGNGAGAVYNTLMGYDPAQNAWSTGPAAPTARWTAAGAALSDGKLYVFGGDNGSTATSSTPTDALEQFSPTTNTWTTLTSLPTARCCLAGVAIGERLYAIGGAQAYNNPGTPLTRFDVFTTASGVWTASTALPGPRTFHGAAVLNGKIYVAGGFDGTNLLSSMVTIVP